MKEERCRGARNRETTAVASEMVLCVVGCGVLGCSEELGVGFDGDQPLAGMFEEPTDDADGRRRYRSARRPIRSDR